MIKNVEISVRFLLNYIQYSFLTGLVILILVATIFIVANLNPNSSFGFFKFFSFIDPIYKTGTFTLGKKETMQIFSASSFILLIIANLIKFLFKNLLAVNLDIKPRLKKIALFTVVTSIHFFAVLLVLFDETLDKNLSFIFILFYFGGLISLTGYFFFDGLLKSSIKVSNSVERS